MENATDVNLPIVSLPPLKNPFNRGQADRTKTRMMLHFLKRLLGVKTAVPDYKTLKALGAQIVDVRSPEEFATGHIPGAINIPVQTLDRSLACLCKDKPVIICCASGNRGATARNLLACNGFTKVHNGGEWLRLNRKLQ